MDSYKPGLLKVTLDSIETKKQVLSKEKTLRNSRRSDLRKVYVSPDLTSKEREANRKLREELNSRRGNGEEVMIRNGKIFDVNSDSFRGFRRARKEPPAMQEQQLRHQLKFIPAAKTSIYAPV